MNTLLQKWQRMDYTKRQSFFMHLDRLNQYNNIFTTLAMNYLADFITDVLIELEKK